MFPRCLVSHFWAVSDGRIPVSGGRWELMKHYGDLQEGMLKEKAQKEVHWIGGFLTQGHC